MALPTSRERYDELIDLVVEVLVREIEAGMTAPAPGPGSILSTTTVHPEVVCQ